MIEIDVTTIPEGMDLKGTVNLIKDQPEKAKELGIVFKRTSSEYGPIHCTCFGVDDGEDCKC